MYGLGVLLIRSHRPLMAFLLLLCQLMSWIEYLAMCVEVRFCLDTCISWETEMMVVALEYMRHEE